MKIGTIIGAVSTAIVCIVAPPAHAQDIRVNITSITKSILPNGVKASGNYATATGVRLTRVQIAALDSTGRVVSLAAGSFNNSTKLWQTGIGDFRMAYYYIAFTVSTPRGNVTYTTPTYRY